MKFTGALKKMATMHKSPVRYAMSLGEDLLTVNQLINKEISIQFKHKHICACGKEVDQVYRANFCRDCFFNNPAAGDAIFRPELSKAHLGIADRDLEFEKAYQLQPHVVYLAISSGVKVGVTRQGQKLHRWMDQGASSAIVLAETSNRFEAGQIEVALKDHISDKTNWRRMLKNEIADKDLLKEKTAMSAKLPEDLKPFLSADDEIFTFTYPVENYPAKVASINLSKTDFFTGNLAGIKGQYLIFDQGQVFNVRSHEGFVVDFDVR